MEEVTLLTWNNTKTHKQMSSACINMLHEHLWWAFVLFKVDFNMLAALSKWLSKHTYTLLWVKGMEE